MQYTVNCDVTSYRNGERKTENPHGVVLPSVAWKKFKVVTIENINFIIEQFSINLTFFQLITLKSMSL